MSDDGGPAFACADENGHQPGMSLRDYFAAQAMAAIISKHPSITNDAEAVQRAAGGHARGAYRYADAMLTARIPSLPGAMSGDK